MESPLHAQIKQQPTWEILTGVYAEGAYTPSAGGRTREEMPSKYEHDSPRPADAA
jgi:hypothetical protein